MTPLPACRVCALRETSLCPACLVAIGDAVRFHNTCQSCWDVTGDLVTLGFPPDTQQLCLSCFVARMNEGIGSKSELRKTSSVPTRPRRVSVCRR